MNPVSSWIGNRLATYLAQSRPMHGTSVAPDLRLLAACLQPADVLLVEGHSRFSTAIKYLTQSTWSHAALYIGDAANRRNEQGERLCLVEADVVEGVRAVPLSQFAGLHARVCRPASLTPEEAVLVIRHAMARIGHRYDMKNIVDLVRYLLPHPPVPQRWRRRMLALGSGDPTRAICSSLIAEAFESVRYPVLPIVELRPSGDPIDPESVEEILHVRHHSLFMPRDFDVSPYFAVVKPTLAGGFDHRALHWDDAASGNDAAAGSSG